MKNHALRPLADITVLVTRPAGQNEGLVDLIVAEGGHAVMAPLLGIESCPDPSRPLALLDAVDPWDWLIFVSVNAVRHALKLGAWARHLDDRTRVAAVGETTAAALRRAGLRVDLVPRDFFNSEGLLADPRLMAVAGQRILIVRGEGGREHLADVLRQRGASVACAETYRRVPVASAALAPCLAGWAEDAYDVVIVTSGEALDRLAELLRRAGLDTRPRPPLIVPGERLSGRARDLGWTRVIPSDQAGDEAILQSIKQWAHARRTGMGPLGALLREPSPPPRVDLPAAPIQEPTPVNPDDCRDHPVPIDNASDPLGDTPLTENQTEMQAAANVPEEPGSLPEATLVKPDKAGRPVKRRGLAWMGYLILIGVVVLAVGGWFLLQELRSRQEGLGGQLTDKTLRVQEIGHQLNSLQSELASLHSQLATLQNQFSGSEARVDRLLGEQGQQVDTRLESLRGDLSIQIQQIQRLLNRTRGDVLIADAEYLLNIANQKLNLVGDVKSVLAAMQAADQRLHESGDPAVFKVREVLAGEISALRKMRAPDLVGISSRLIALEGKVAALPLILPHAGTVKQLQKQQVKEPREPGPEAGEEGDALDKALSGIRDLVTVRRTDQPVEAVLMPEQVEALRQLLLLKLETSRAALLRNDEHLYRDSLATAADWIGQHFDTHAAETQGMLDELRQLGEQAFSVAYPDISKSMVMLQNIEKLRLETEDAALHGNPADRAGSRPADSGPAAGAVMGPPAPRENKTGTSDNARPESPAGATPPPTGAEPEAPAPGDAAVPGEPL